jgi:hypothetical protein
LVTASGAPGAVTSTTRWPSSRCASSSGDAACANCSSAASWLRLSLPLAISWSICWCSWAAVRSSAAWTDGFSVVEPSTSPIASARKTPTIETRW